MIKQNYTGLSDRERCARNANVDQEERLAVSARWAKHFAEQGQQAEAPAQERVEVSA